MSPFTRNRMAVLVSLLASSMALAMPPDGGITDLQAQMQGKVIGLQGDPVLLPRPSVDSSAAVKALLATPITADAAVRIALLNNPGLQASMGAAGLGVTDLQGSNTPAKRQLQRDITTLSAQAFKAWVQAVAAAHSAHALRDAQATAQTAGELARRMVQAGNLSKLNQAQYQDRLSEAALAVARADQQAFVAREQLVQVLGLWGAQTQFELADTLPALPNAAQDMPDFEARAVQARTDLAQATFDWQLKRTPPTAPRDLWDIMGDGASVRALAVKVRSEARAAYFSYRSSYDIAKHLQTEVLPLRQFIHDELVLRYNGMLTSVFDVLADTQAMTMAKRDSVVAQRDFWLAHANLQALLAGAPIDALGGDASATNSEARAAASQGGH
ncbi:MAG: TolC family protein [Rhodoferax sp.]|nr:TolC family protein [Rhodoferax sp.]